MDLLERLSGAWHYFVAGLSVLLSVIGSGHAVLYKRDTRAAVLWVGFIWLVPLVGAVLYFLLGVNRIRRRAASLRGDLERYLSPASAAPCATDEFAEFLPDEAKHLATLSHLVEKVLSRPLMPGNRLEPLVNGDAAYPAMIQAIER